jgi:hypothetical protein
MKITQSTILRLGAMMLALAAVFFACKKNDINPSNETGTTDKVMIYLTDDPCQFDSVFIDIKYIELKIDTSSYGRHNRFNDRDDNHYGHEWFDDHREDHHHFDQNGIWDTLQISPGLYNILALRNGNDIQFGTGVIPAGKILKMRLTTGDRSYVVVSGEKYDLSLFHSDDNYTYVRIHGSSQDRQFKPGQTTMWLDFNICRSIKFHGHNYYLTPYLRVFSMSATGSLTGKVAPHAAQPYIVAWNGADTASALPERDGRFKMQGLSPGNYSVIYQGAFGYKDTTLTGIKVSAGINNKLPDITLHQ